MENNGWQHGRLKRSERQRSEGKRARRKRKSKKNNKVIISDEIRATVVNPVVNHGLTMQETGQRVQPNRSRFSVAPILLTFRRENG